MEYFSCDKVIFISNEVLRLEVVHYFSGQLRSHLKIKIDQKSCYIKYIQTYLNKMRKRSHLQSSCHNCSQPYHVNKKKYTEMI